MVRKYIRKTNGPSYPTERLNEAVRVVKSGELSLYHAAIKYNIPKSTLCGRVRQSTGKAIIKGRPTVLSSDKEKSVAECLQLMERHGFRLTRSEIIHLVSDYVKQKDIKNPFKNDVPGVDWFFNFKKRHNVYVNKLQTIEHAHKNACNPFIIYPYLSTLKDILDELNLHSEPDSIWNVGLKSLSATRTISSSENDITVLLGFSADGQKTPPLIVNKGKYIKNEWISEQDYPGTVYAATISGLMETAVFETFFDYIFLPTIGHKRPVLLIYEGESRHIGISIIEKARKANVTIMKIPSYTSCVLHPLELAVNEWLEEGWDESLAEWKKLHEGLVLPKQEASKIIGQIWSSIEPQFCAKGFKMAGIFPYNKKVITEDMFDSSQLKNWKSQRQLGEWDSFELSLTEVSTSCELLDLGLNIKVETESSLCLESE